MRVFLLLLLSISITYAKSDDTCYSVQLTSFKFKKNSTYDFSQQNYPESCRLISFSNINSVRCGCFEKYADARKALKKLAKKYHKPLIVTTYKYRFLKKVLKTPKKTVTTAPEVVKAQKETLHVNKEEVPIKKEKSTFLDIVTYQGNIDLALQSYMKAPAGKEKKKCTPLCQH